MFFLWSFFLLTTATTAEILCCARGVDMGLPLLIAFYLAVIRSSLGNLLQICIFCFLWDGILGRCVPLTLPAAILAFLVAPQWRQHGLNSHPLLHLAAAILLLHAYWLSLVLHTGGGLFPLLPRFWLAALIAPPLYLILDGAARKMRLPCYEDARPFPSQMNQQNE